MNSLEDYDLVDGEPEERPLSDVPPPSDRNSPRPSVWPALAVLCALAIAVFAFYRWKGADEPVPAANEVNRAIGRGSAPAQDEGPLPRLDASDGFLRELMGRFTSRPEVGGWLSGGNIARSFVESIETIASGRSPRTLWAVAAPSAPFSTSGSSNAPVIAEASYARFDTIADVVASVDTAAAVRAYRRVKPLLQQAFADRGFVDKDFDATLGTAINHLLTAPVPDGPIRVMREPVVWRYADPELEGLTGAQKQLIRMGPRNQKLIQQKLLEILKALEPPSGGTD